MSDKQVRQNIIDELDFEPSVNAANIGVAFEAGVATLTGHVASYAEKFAAIAATRRINGVRAIAEEIEVRYPTDKKVADDEIAKRALSILAWDTLLPRNAIQVTVKNGWVTLTGGVGWWYQRKSAEEDIRKLSGVAGVINDIVIEPQLNIPDVKEKIEQALKRRIEAEVRGIRVTVHEGNKVTLEGKVRDWDERFAVENAAWSAPGVKRVEDRLTIG
jgi:osmotically-inducible protein OsmY